MNFDTIRLTKDARGVTDVVLNRPEKHNAMNAQMISELSDAANALAADQAVRAVVLRADGPSFCAGGDLGWMREQAEKDRAGKIQEAGALAAMLGLWNVLPKPVVGRVHGAAYGGGLGLLAICDVVVAEETTRFALTETRLGLIPATIGPFVVRRMGEAFARQVFFTARPFDAAFLMRAGLVARSCKAGDLDAAVENEILAILKCAPGAVARAKTLCRTLAGSDPVNDAEYSANMLADCWETEETREGISAFFAKTTPSWRQSDQG
ncbi:crotonase/enoyl-CoA hydratase family protein [Stappia sp. ES.058]|uniref:crotonase/enoyl-CoA hydratase family protein n=1 Tax=Stappia sp. ES.058 TaxID=1881061 RepID=UPI00087CE7B7|nr:crotonase/enoyl-CoA hydratase family protein [Stappia sp. ES.058]SDT94639.1 methylglutaconyl-CoA hydratase [Stappia sp. ES.058]